MAIKRDVVFLQQGTESDPEVVALMNNPRFQGGADQLAYIDELDGMVRAANFQSERAFEQLARGWNIPLQTVRGFFSEDIRYTYLIRYAQEEMEVNNALLARVINGDDIDALENGTFEGNELWLDTRRFIRFDDEWVNPIEYWESIVSAPEDRLDIARRIQTEEVFNEKVWLVSKNTVSSDGKTYWPQDITNLVVGMNIDEVTELKRKLIRDENPNVPDFWLRYKQAIRDTESGEIYPPISLRGKTPQFFIEDLIGGYATTGSLHDFGTKMNFNPEDVERNEFRIAKLRKDDMVKEANLFGWESSPDYPRRKKDRTKDAARDFLRTVSDEAKAAILNNYFRGTPEFEGEVVDMPPAKIVSNPPTRYLDNNPAEVEQTPIMLVDNTFQSTSLYTLDGVRRSRAILALAITSRDNGLLAQNPTLRTQDSGVFGERSNTTIESTNPNARQERTRVATFNIVDTINRIENMLDGGDYDNDGKQAPGNFRPYLDNFWTRFDGFSVVTVEREDFDTGEIIEYEEIDFWFDYYPNYGE